MTIERKSRLDTLAVTSLVACCFLWGLNQVAAKVAITEVPPLAQAAVRSLGGALLVFIWARLRGIALFGRDGSLRGGLLAGLLFAAEFGCIFLGLQFTTASRMAVFIYISPFIVALGMPFISKSEKLKRTQMAGLVIAFAGVAWALPRVSPARRRAIGSGWATAWACWPACCGVRRRWPFAAAS